MTAKAEVKGILRKILHLIFPSRSGERADVCFWQQFSQCLCDVSVPCGRSRHTAVLLGLVAFAVNTYEIRMDNFFLPEEPGGLQSMGSKRVRHG